MKELELRTSEYAFGKFVCSLLYIVRRAWGVKGQFVRLPEKALNIYFFE